MSSHFDNWKTSAAVLAFAISVFWVAIPAAPAGAAVITWTSGDATDNWNVAANWSTAVPGSADEARFDQTATGVPNGNNVVDAPFTVQKLTFGAVGAVATAHATTINSGMTLLVTGDADGSLNAADFSVANDPSTYTGAKTTLVTIAGGGTLQVGNVGTSTADIVIGRRGPSGTGAGTIGATLDMSGLAAFTAHVDEFLVGQPGFENLAHVAATLRLAQTNTILANTLTIGDSLNNGNSGMNAVRLGQSNLLQADNIYVGRKKTNGELTFDAGLVNPTVTITNRAGTGGANLYIGFSDVGTGVNSTGLVDFTAGTVNATLNNVVIGRIGGSGGSGSGELRMAQGTIAAASVTLAQVTGGPTTPLNTNGTITMTGGTFAVTGSVLDGGGTSTINLDGGAMTVGGNFQVDNLRVGSGGSGQLTVTGSSVLVGSGTGNNAVLGRTLSSSGPNSVGTADFSGAATVGFNVNELRVGYKTGGGSTKARGTLWLGATNNLTANTLVVGESDSAFQTDPGDESVLHLGSTNVVRANTIIVGGPRSSGVVDIAAGGTLDVASRSGGRANLYVARNNVGTTSRATGVLDLSGAASFTALLDLLAVGDKGDLADGRAVGTLTLAQTNNIDANQVIVGRSGNTGADQPADQSRLRLGGGVNTIFTPVLLVGDRKAAGLVDFATAGGTLNLGSSTARTEITLGRKSVDTGANPAGTMDLRNGTANIFASNINLGQETNLAGAGTPSGTLWLGNGTLDVSGNMSENQPAGGAGNSAVYVVGNQTFTIGGAVAVDTFVIGLNGTPGSVTFAGSTAHIGDSANPTALYVGRRDANTATTFQGRLDLTGVATFSAHLSDLLVGSAVAVGADQGQPYGELLLAADNTITATNIVIGESPGVGLGSVTSRIGLGASNVIQAATLTVGGNKASRATGGGVLDFLAPGGVLNLGASASRVNLTIGNQTVGTGGGSIGIMDMTGGAINAFINQLVIGTKPNAATGATSGTFTMTDGVVDANSVVLARRSDAGTAGTVSGTLNLRGGWLKAGSISKSAIANIGADAVNFNWTGGRLTVDTFGFDLAQSSASAPSILAPGRTNAIGMTTINGNYTMNTGTIEIQLSGYDPGDQGIVGAANDGIGYDLVTVSGNATLAGNVLAEFIGGFVPNLGDKFDVMQVSGTTLDISALTVVTVGPHNLMASVVSGPGNTLMLELTAVPEPSAFVLGALALGTLAGYARRRRRARGL